VPEAPLSERAVYTARPTVRIDGRESETLNELLVAMEMTESEGGMASLELTVRNIADDAAGRGAFAWEDAEVLDFGKTLAVYAGDEREPREIFRGTVTALEGVFPRGGTPELVVLAEDALQRARMARRTAVHEEASIARLARDLAGRLGLTPVVTGFSDSLGTQVQINESDLAFLRRLLAERDGDLQVVGEELHVSPRAEVRRGSVELAMHGQLLRARVLADLAHQASQVTVTGWNPARGARISVASTGAHAGPGRGATGSDTLQRALGPRTEHAREVAVLDDAEARAVADTLYDRRARRFLTVDATAQGNPALRGGTHVSLTGLGPRFDNTYYVVRAVHRFDTKEGYLTDFEAECAFLGEG
jgi:uncharacterized protein